MLDELNAAVALIATYLKPLIPNSTQNPSLLETNYVILASKQAKNDGSETSENSDICNGENVNVPEHSRTNDCDLREQDICSLERILHEALVSALQAKFEGHWYPLLPSKGSGFRCLKFGAGSVDMAIISACESVGQLHIHKQDIVNAIPNDLILWIDPGEVSYKIGDSVPLTTVYSKPCPGDKESAPRIHPAHSGKTFAIGHEKNLKMQERAKKSSQPNLTMHEQQDSNNNNVAIGNNPLSNHGIGGTPFKKYSTGSLIMGSHGPSPSILGDDPANILGLQNPPIAKHPNAISSHVLNSANDFSSPPMTMQQAGMGNLDPVGIMRSRGQISHPANMMDSGMGSLGDFGYHPVTSRPTTLPGVKGSVGSSALAHMGAPFSSPIHNNGHHNSAMTRNANVSRNLGMFWKSASSLGSNKSHLQSSPFGPLNPDASVFSPADSPEQHILPHPGGSYNINSPYPVSAHTPMSNHYGPSIACSQNDTLGAVGIIGGGQNAPVIGGVLSFPSEDGGAGGMHGNIANAPPVMSVSGNNSQHSANTPSPPGVRSGISSLVSPPQRFYNASTANSLAQLQLLQHQQAFRGGSPVDYGNGTAYNNSRSPSMKVCGNLNQSSQVPHSQTTQQPQTQSTGTNVEVSQASVSASIPSPNPGTGSASSASTNTALPTSLASNQVVNATSVHDSMISAPASAGSSSSSSTGSGSPVQNQTQQQFTPPSSAQIGGNSNGNIKSLANTSSVNSVATPLASNASLVSGNLGSAISNGEVPTGLSSGQTPEAISPPTRYSSGMNQQAPQNHHSRGAHPGGHHPHQQQLMTADAFAATKFGSTKLKSRKSNINLSQMSPTQFEAYMRHKTSTMHSRPPHTNYTDAYPTSGGCYGSNAPGHHNSASSSNNVRESQQAMMSGSQHHGGSPGSNHGTPNGGYYGPLSPVGRGGSSGSSTSTPSPCGSYPGFPSPAMSELIPPNGGLIRGQHGSQLSNNGMMGRQNGILGNAQQNIDQLVNEMCEDPFFRQNNNLNSFFANSAGQGSFGGQSNHAFGNHQAFGLGSGGSYDSSSGFAGSPESGSGSSEWNQSSAAALRYQQQFQAAAAVTASANNSTNAVSNTFLPPFANLASRVGAN